MPFLPLMMTSAYNIPLENTSSLISPQLFVLSVLCKCFYLPQLLIPQISRVLWRLIFGDVYGEDLCFPQKSQQFLICAFSTAVFLCRPCFLFAAGGWDTWACSCSMSWYVCWCSLGSLGTPGPFWWGKSWPGDRAWGKSAECKCLLVGTSTCCLLISRTSETEHCTLASG